MNLRKITSVVLLICVLAFSSVAGVNANEINAATRGEVVEMLLAAVDDYNPDVQKSDIIKGYEDGLLHEERFVTRAESLVMLKRAFGELPELTGHNQRVAITSGDFTDIPDWAESELQDVFDSGIVAGTAEGIFSPDEFVTREQMDLFIRRVFALYGTNLKDDFYAAINKDGLNSLEIKSGRDNAGFFNDLRERSLEQVMGIIEEITASEWEKGTDEYKIAAFYNSILDKEGRNKAGIEPIKEYYELIDAAKTVEDLTKLNNTLYADVLAPLYFGFIIDVDLMDTNKYILSFSTVSESRNKGFYDEDTSDTDLYLAYMEELFRIAGEPEEDISRMVKECYEFEKYMSGKSIDMTTLVDYSKIYNIYTLDEIKEMFAGVDIDSVFNASGLENTDRIMIADVGATQAFADYYKDENLEVLKSYAKYNLLSSFGGFLNEEFTDAEEEFENAYSGVEGSYTDEEMATGIVQSVMADYIGKIYAEKYFSENAKKDVEKMVADIISVFREKLINNDWMSEETKSKAIEKLDSLSVKIGYPDEWDSLMDEVEILDPKDGGSYFDNKVAIQKFGLAKLAEEQTKGVDKSEWMLNPYEVNAGYLPTSNEIIFPAAILQAPFYDENASYEQNLGGIGYVIAHEITHAFDIKGSQFDANGNLVNWWTEKDYEEFSKKCDAMVVFYDGQEAYPGIQADGNLTLSENTADHGAVSCITKIASQLENPDYKAMYENLAKCWLYTATREKCYHQSVNDEHSPAKLRVNRVVVACDEFYETYGITEGDGMYIAPEDRVKIW